MTSIYVAWFTITVEWDLYYNKHLYLVKDPDSDTSVGQTSDQTIIRGGDGQNADFRSGWAHFPGNPADLEIEHGFSSAASEDGLDNPTINTDYNEDGDPDTAIDRHYTAVNLAPALSNMDFDFDSNGTVIADEVWQAMESYAFSLIGLYKYGLTDINCQATVTSVLSSVGIDFGINVPTGSTYSQYVGRDVLLDGAGNTKLTAFYDPAEDWTYHRRNGQDTLILQHGATVEIIDQFDGVESEFSGLTTVEMEGFKVNDVTFSLLINDFEIKEGTNVIVKFDGAGKAKVGGGRTMDTIAFDFDDYYVHHGDNFDNTLGKSTLTKDTILLGGQGDDAMTSGSGDDIHRGGQGSDVMALGAGFDQVSYRDFDESFSGLFIDSVSIAVDDRAAGNFTVTTKYNNAWPDDVDTITGAERVAHAEWHVNTTDTGVQRDNSIAGQKASGGFAGGYVVAWESQNTGGLDYQIRTQRFDESGNPAGSEFAPSLGATHPQFDPSVTSLANGGFVIAWQSKNSGADIKTFATIYNATGGVVAQDIEVFEDPDPPDYANYWSREYAKDLAEGHDGKIMVVAEGGGAQSTSTDIYGQLMSATGAVDPTQKVIVNDDVNGGGQTDPAIAAIPGGGYVVTYTNNHSSGDGSGNSVWYRKLDAAGTPVGSSVRVNTVGTYSHQKDSDVAVLESGEFVVVWTGKDSAGDGVVAGLRQGEGNQALAEDQRCFM